MTDRRVGKYEVLELVGRGGAGEVWRARDSDLGRTVALKLLQRTSTEDLARFRREAHAVARLNHPNIAQLYEFGADPPHLAMQFVDGAPISKPEPLAQAARAVQYAHEQGLLHRDLKPANILVDATGRAFVLDFGLAREVSGEKTAMSMTGDILGTPSFMAPEQARGEVSRLDARTDVYGLGATLYSILAGRPPHTGPSAFEILRRVIEEEPTPPGGDSDLQTIALKALEKDPARRYATAAEFADDLDRWTHREPIVARPASTLYRLRKQIQRRPAVWGLSATLTVAILAGAAFGTVQLLEAKANLERALAEQTARMNQARAQAFVEEARSRLSDVEAAMYIDGCSLARTFGALEEVRGKCREALAAVPDYPAARYWIGRSYRIEARYDEALEELRRATASEDAPGYIWVERARAAMEQGLMRRLAGASFEALREAGREATECAEHAGGVERDLAEAYRLWGAADPGLREHVAAAWAAHEGEPGAEELHFILGAALLGAEAIDELTRAIEIRPGHFLALLARGGARYRADDFAGARDDAARALEIQPNLVEARHNLAAALNSLGEYARAEEEENRVVEARPDLAVARATRGSARMSQGNLAGAEEEFVEALRIDPGCSVALVNRAILRHNAGDYRGALEDLDRAVAADPGASEAYVNRGRARHALGDFAGAEEDYTRALTLKPGNAMAWYNRGTARRAMGHLREAIEDYTEAVEHAPRFAEAWGARGQSKWETGDLEGAIEDLRRCLNVAPPDWPLRPEVQRALDLMERSGGGGGG